MHSGLRRRTTARPRGSKSLRTGTQAGDGVTDRAVVHSSSYSSRNCLGTLIPSTGWRPSSACSGCCGSRRALLDLQLIVATLIRSVPEVFNVIALMSIVFCVYGVAGYRLFREFDPNHWRTLGISLVSLFRVATLEDWTAIMYAALEHHRWAWAYFVSFVVVETFVVLNLFVAVVVNSLDEAKHDRLREIAVRPPHAELRAELPLLREALERLQERGERDLRTERLPIRPDRLNLSCRYRLLAATAATAGPDAAVVVDGLMVSPGLLDVVVS